MLHAKCAKFLACYTPGSNLMNFPEQGNICNNFCVLNGIANLINISEMSNIETAPDTLIVFEMEEGTMRAKRAEILLTFC